MWIGDTLEYQVNLSVFNENSNNIIAMLNNFSTYSGVGEQQKTIILVTNLTI